MRLGFSSCVVRMLFGNKRAVVTLGNFGPCPTLMATQEKWSQTSVAGMEMCVVFK